MKKQITRDEYDNHDCHADRDSGCQVCRDWEDQQKGIDFSKDNIYDAIGRPDLKPKTKEELAKAMIDIDDRLKKVENKLRNEGYKID